MSFQKQFIHQLLAKNSSIRSLFWKIKNSFFPGSLNYWEKRYRSNGNSGKGSYGKNAVYKADFLNQFVRQHSISKVIELGCGDGNQLRYFNFPAYIGFDVSQTAIQHCQIIFKKDTSKEFSLYQPGDLSKKVSENMAPLAISLDVIFHLVEDEIFEKYMHDLFLASSHYVIIYAWDVDDKLKFHVRQRNFSKWISENIAGFALKEIIKGDNAERFCDFYAYEKMNLKTHHQ